MYKSVRLKRHKEESLKRFHPWVFSGAIDKMDDGIAEGEVVKVFSSEDDFLAVGHYQIGSIAVRVLSFSDVVIDKAFWCEQLQSAIDARKSIGLIPINDDAEVSGNTFRLVHGEGDNLPGLVIDCYGDTAVVQAHSVGMHYSRKEISEALVEVMNGRSKNV